MNHLRYILLLALPIMLSSCVKDVEELDVVRPGSEYIGFYASLYGEATEATTRTMSKGASSYLSYEEEEWPVVAEDTRGQSTTTLNGLNVAMFGFSYAANGSSATPVMIANPYKFIDNEQLEATDTPVMWRDVTEALLSVYGYSPIAPTITTTTDNGNTTLTYAVSDTISNQVDLIASEVKQVPADYGQNIPLTFKHILTGVRFKAGFNCTVNSITIAGVHNTGSYTFGDVWHSQSGKASYTITMPTGGKEFNAGEYITFDDVLLMIPQELPEGANVIFKYNGNQTIEAPLKGMRWDSGAMVTYTINQSSTQQYIYFDLFAGNVSITPTSYSGYVFVNGVATAVTGTGSTTGKHFYIYQSTNANKNQTGYATTLNVGACRLPSYAPVKVGNKYWSEFITNNTNVENVIDTWDTKNNITADANNTNASSVGAVRQVGRSSTGYYINVAGNTNRDVLKCEITVDNIYSRYMHESPTTRSLGGITFKPNKDYSELKVNLVGDNRVGCVHYYSGRDASSRLLEHNKLIFQGSGSLTVACANFYKAAASESTSSSYNGDKVTGYYSNHWSSAIGGNDSEGNAIGIQFNNGTIYAGTTQAENCTAIGGGGNDRGVITIDGGVVTAVATTTGTAIGGGIGFHSAGGTGTVTINGGTVFAYNHANEWEIPSAAIGSAGSWQSSGGSGTVTITGGYVYAQTALGTAIGGGSSKTRQGGNATINISGGYITAKSISSLDKHTNKVYPAGSGIGGGTGGNSYATDGVTPSYGGSATIKISGSPTIRTGSIGGGKTNNPNGKIGHANITISGGDISAQFVMAGGAAEGATTTFDMSGGTISNSDVDSNEFYHVQKNGGAVYMEDGTFTMSGGTIRNCNSEIGGAVYIKQSSDAISKPQFTMSNGVIEKCMSEGNGGAIYLEGGEVTLSGGTICNNIAQKGSGGAIYIAGGNLTMPEGGTATVTENSALHRGGAKSGNGGGIYITASSAATTEGDNNDVNVLVYSGSIKNNACDSNGGGLCVDMEGNNSVANIVLGQEGSGPDISGNVAVTYGGGLYAIGQNAMVTINGGRIMDNHVENYVPNENVDNQLGSVVLNGGEVTHVVVTFDLNSDNGYFCNSVDNDGNAAVVDRYYTYFQNIVTSTNSALIAPVATSEKVGNLFVGRPLYKFIGWNTRPDGQGTTIANGATMNISTDLTLYAQWQAQ